MSLILDLPPDIDDRLQRNAERNGVAKESLAIDLLARSLDELTDAEDFWSPVSFEELAAAQGVAPVTDGARWLSSLPTIEGADELADYLEESRRERREQERNAA